MLERKGYHSTDIMFPFFCAFVKKATGYAEKEELMKVYSLYSELVVEIYRIHLSG